jgi:unsaturated rhamnogalacturonyl hydrolase
MFNKHEIYEKIDKVCNSLLQILYTEDEQFMQNMKALNTEDLELKKYKYWEWTQGVGLYGFYKIYQYSGDKKYLGYLEKYYDERLKDGLPGKNVNTVAPMLTMMYLYEETKNEKYLGPCKEWASWIYNEMPRTKEKGLQHITSDSTNNQELWDDTLVMTVLFLARAGIVLNEYKYVEEAIRQYLLHTKYLADRKTGLWFHGWTFEGNHNFAQALWGRGNSWITIGIPDFIEMLEGNIGVKEFLKETLIAQIEKLAELQDESGMWHTLLDDPTSYVEASATAGFCYGILKSVRKNYIDASYLEVGLKAAKALMNNIDDKGVVRNVSYGTPMGRESVDFYKAIPICPMPYGQAMALLALIEVLTYLDK